MANNKKSANYEADIKEAKALARQAVALGSKVARQAKASYDRSDAATKAKIKKAAVIGALSLAGLMGAKKIIKKKKR